MRSGSDRLSDAFARAKREGRLALVAYLMSGDPDLETSARLARVTLDEGADVIELGVPFSDPLADGATVQRAAERALANGTRLGDVIALARDLRRDRDVPILLMGYANPFYRYGLERAARDMAAGGLAGIIVPDLPYEEAGEWVPVLHDAGLVQISLVAPTTTDERLARIVPAAKGFLYCVSLTGVTGAREGLAPGVADFVARVRRHTRLPVVVGFGISRPEHLRALRGVADGAAVGSALVDAAARGEAELGVLVRSLREAAA